MQTKEADKGRRNNISLISSLVDEITLLYGCQTTARQLGVRIPHHNQYHNQLFFVKIKFTQINSICFQNRQQLITGGHFFATLVQRLLCFNCKYAVKYRFNMGKCILSRRHFFSYPSPTCITTLNAPYAPLKQLLAEVFHPTVPLLATDSTDNTVKLWLLSSDYSSATCVATLNRRNIWVLSVAFLPTDIKDTTAKVWRVLSDKSSATCVATLQGHTSWVLSVKFHQTTNFMAPDIDFSENTVKLWCWSSDYSSLKCAATLTGLVGSVAVHPTASHLASPNPGTVKLYH